jgi:hypothetical protein
LGGEECGERDEGAQAVAALFDVSDGSSSPQFLETDFEPSAVDFESYGDVGLVPGLPVELFEVLVGFVDVALLVAVVFVLDVAPEPVDV